MLSAIGLCAISFVVTLNGTGSDSAELEALARALLVAAPLGVGLFLWWGPPPLRRFGWLLVLAGVGWWLTTLSGSDEPVPFTIGRLAGWTMEPLVFYLALAYPTGRLDTRGDRALVLASATLFAVLFLPTALLVESFPAPSPWSTCIDDCPANAFNLLDTEPAWVADVVQPVRELLAAALFIALAVRFAERVRSASSLMRRVRTPVLPVAAVRAGLAGAILLVRLAVPDADTLVQALWWIGVAVSIAFSIAFLVGALRWRLFMGRCLQRLAVLFRAPTSHHELATVLAEAFEDPELELLEPGAAPTPGPGRARTDIHDGDRVVAVVVHDEALCDEQAFIEAAASAALVTLECRRLAAETTSLLEELRESRVRVMSGADDERQRIQRDLHDGAQQRLLALRVRLELAADHPTDPEALRGFARDIDAAVEEVRSFAYGVYPPLLSSRGLVDALRSAARRCALPARVDGDHVGRYPPEIERAAYFCCLEAMQNASKHASGATEVSVTLADDGKLRLEVRDDGSGFDVATTPPGMGLVNMRDRVASVGGELDLRSRPSDGTSVLIALPTGD